MNYLDLFHGIGGFALGAYWAGMKFEHHYCSDIEPWCQELYAKRFPDSIQLGDITKIDTSKLPAGDWIITGGFPCQDISIAGKGAGIHGERSGLWFEYWRIINDLRPRFAIMENVGMLVHRGLREVLGSLAEIGYDAEWQNLCPGKLGGNITRDRIFIITYPVSIKHEQGIIEKTPYWKSILSGQPFGGDQRFRKRSDLPASRFCRKSNDVPNQVDRLKGLGNAIVPQVAELLFRQIFAKTS